jgi:KDO2-lipid IV(A) lauroyltransferase
MILAAAHLGNWEICGLYSAIRHPTSSLYRPPRLEALDVIMRAGRENTAARLIPTEARGIRSLIQALNGAQCVGIPPDQVPNVGSGVYAPFFGIDAYTMMLITRLAVKRRTPVIFTYARRLRGGGYHIHYHGTPAQIYDPNPVIAATALNQMLKI